MWAPSWRANYRFRQFLAWKAWQAGKNLLVVNEAYTSKTCSWSGKIIANLGGRRVVAGSDGVRVERDTNGATGYSYGLWEIHRQLHYRHW